MIEADLNEFGANVAVQVGCSNVADFARSIAELAPTDFTRDVLSGTAVVLDNRANPLRLNLFAVSIRILLDHLMEALAPRDQVEACRWFAFEENQDKPTRRQRLAYALHGGFMPAQVTALAGIDADELVDEATAAYRELNKHVHGREDTIVRDVEEQDKVADQILAALADLLQAERDYRSEIVEGVADSLQSNVIEQFLTETIDNLDIMATHYNIEWVGVNDHRIVKVDAKFVEYEVTGSVGVTLLYGSGSDRRRGEGAELSDEFPFEIGFKVPVEEPDDLSQAEITRNVDTDAWYGLEDGDGDDDDIEDSNVDLSGKA